MQRTQKPLPSAQEPRQSHGCRETRKGRAGSPCGLNKQTFVIISLLHSIPHISGDGGVVCLVGLCVGGS